MSKPRISLVRTSIAVMACVVLVAACGDHTTATAAEQEQQGEEAAASASFPVAVDHGMG